MSLNAQEKSSSPDWIVEYQWLGGPWEAMVVFGVDSAEIALAEAQYSLDLAGEAYAVARVSMAAGRKSHITDN